MARPGAEPIAGGLGTRIVSAAVLAPVVLGATYFGTPLFEILVAVAALILAWEWSRLCSGRPLWLSVGLVYVLVPCAALLFLRGDPENGRAMLMWLFAVVWSADTGAYLFGSLIGGPKLSPRISPSKTWSGLFGGIGSAGVAGAMTVMVLEKNDFLVFSLVSAGIGAVSQLGDLGESWVKRRFEVKDMSAIIPGHGGLFDRVDGLLAAAVTVAVLTLFQNGGPFAWT